VKPPDRPRNHPVGSGSQKVPNVQSLQIVLCHFGGQENKPEPTAAIRQSVSSVRLVP
jgi:hypothetical protein